MGPEAFDYALPEAQIAQVPAQRRSDARLLVALGDRRVDATAATLREHLPADALVVVNASKVVRARVHATRADGRRFELLLCDPGPGQGPGARVRAWVRAAKRLRPDDVLEVGELRLRVQGPDPIDPRARELAIEAGDVLSTLAAHGEVPLPPYVRRAAGPDARDAARYQTVYAGPEGSVAAPTAGLHLERELYDALDVAEVVLHVGPGTFLPMDVADVGLHRVGAERVTIGADAARRIRDAQVAGRPIVAVGTTVTRALEGVALQQGNVEAFEGTIDLVITPGFSFRVITHLLTNFHLPRSSLLMLVCSFAGRERTLSCYAHAVSRGYRFYSYGDCMLVDRGPA
jgi:S-adenosylmethionine:tRNA ribosyltransferase-isomerase